MKQVFLEKDYLKKQKEQAEADLLKAIAYLKYLYQQEKYLYKKATKIIYYNIKDLNKLKAIK